MGSNYYMDVLQNVSVPVADALIGDAWTFSQDNASLHKSQITTEFSGSCDFDVLTWLAKSPNLNMIENLWGALIRRVYRSGCQFADVLALQEAICVRLTIF